MSAAVQRWLSEPTGALLAGSLLACLAASRLHAFPTWLLLPLATGAGLLSALPWLVLVMARVMARARPEPSAPRLLLRAAVLTGTALVLLDLAAYFALRRLAVLGALIVQESAFRSSLLPVGIGAVAVLGAWCALRASRRLGPDAPIWPWLAGGIACLLASALLGAWHPPEVAAGEAPALVKGTGKPRLLVVGIDAIGAELFERHGDRMPALSSFAAGAARGRLEPEPPYLSPAIWTSVATGLPSAEHGVSNYELWADHEGVGTIPIDRFYTDPATALFILPAIIAWRSGQLAVLPSTRLHREGTPFWEHHGGSRGVVCWPASWPAQPGEALLVTDRWPPDRTETLFHYRQDLPAQVWPPELAESLAPFRRDPAEPPDPELLTLADFTDLERDAFLAAQRDDLAAPRDQPFANLHYAWLNDRSCLDAARWMLAEQQPDVAVVYLMGPDLMGHAFLPDAESRVAGFEDPDAQRLSGIYGAYLARLDQDLAWLLGSAGPNTTTVIITDHGMQHQGTGLFSVWHAGDGLVFAQGPGFAAGEELGRRPAWGWADLLAPVGTRDIEPSP